jgi:2-polyprenyl-6-methoxyphenol hydroxylase-like FAD-dependent oxidoreductase
MQVSGNRTVLIAGAGIAGPTLAYWLRRRGFAPTLVESAPALRTGGYMIDFWGVGYDVAERMGLIAALRRLSYDISEVRIVDADGTRIGGFDARAFQAASGDRFFSIPRGDLARELFRTVENDVEIVFDDGVAAIAQDAGAVHVAFRRGAARSFALAVGADGLHSAVRRLVFGEEKEFEKYLGYSVASFMVADYPQRDENVYLSYAAPGRQIARYALRGNRTAFFFLFAEPQPLNLPHHDMAAQKRLLRRVFGGDGWETAAILDAMDGADEFYFDTVSQIRMPHWSRGRVALVGDAAACPSLLAGQGAAFAMAGAYILADSLARSADAPASALRAYERALQPFIVGKQQAAERFGGWFAPRTRLGMRLRNAATGLLNLPVIGPWLAGRMFADRFALPDAR